MIGNSYRKKLLGPVPMRSALEDSVFGRSVKERRKQYEIEGDDENFVQWVQDVIQERGEKYLQQLKQRWGEELLEEVYTWAVENLSPVEMEEKSRDFEALVAEFAVANPDVGSEVLGKFLGTDEKPAKRIRSPLDTEIGQPIFSEEKGKWVESTIKPVKERPPLPSERSLRKMGADELRKILNEYGSGKEE